MEKRCALHNWPPYHVLNDIIKHGCHLVPVGSKILVDGNELKWRTYFSLAEPCANFMLCTFKNILKRGCQPRHGRTIPLFIFYEDYNILVYTTRT